MVAQVVILLLALGFVVYLLLEAVRGWHHDSSIIAQAEALARHDSAAEGQREGGLPHGGSVAAPKAKPVK